MARRRLCSFPPIPEPQLLSFSDSVRLILETRRAGARPKKIPARNEIRKEMPSRRASRPTEFRPGTSTGIRRTSIRTDASPSASPRPPPSSPSATLSVSSWQVARWRLAPRAALTAISLCRPVARANSRFATVAHTISRTQPTAPSRTSSGVRRGPIRAWISGTIRALLALTSGCCLFNALAIAAISACARSIMTPGFSRAITSR